MTTTPNGGSAPAGNPQGGSPAQQTQPPQGGAAVVDTGANWLNGLQDADNREIVAKKGWDKSSSPDVVLTSYRELESRLGKSTVLPNAESPQEDWDKLYGSLGRPEKPDGYQFKLPDGVPADFPYDDQFATEYRVAAHGTGLNPRQAQNLHDWFVKRSAQQMQTVGEQIGANVQKAHQEIISKWGSPDGEQYKGNVASAGRALSKSGLTETFKRAGLITAKGEIADASLAFFLATVGEGLYREGKLGGEPNQLIGSNPWKAGQENLQEQGRILKETPALAETLIRAAGKDPKKELWKPPS